MSENLALFGNKAEHLLSNSTMTSDVLGHEFLFTHMVRSSRNKMPHFVSAPKQFTGQFICDSHYPFVSYSSYKLCSLTAAAAEVNRLLSMLG